MSQGETSRGPAPLCSSKHSHLLTDALACTASETSGHLLYNIYFTCSTADVQLQTDETGDDEIINMHIQQLFNTTRFISTSEPRSK